MMAKPADKNIQSGNSRVQVTIYGQVNKALRVAEGGWTGKLSDMGATSLGIGYGSNSDGAHGSLVAFPQVGADAAGDAGGGGLDRIPGEVGVARRGLDLGVAEQLADHGEALAERQRPRGEGMAYIM